MCMKHLFDIFPSRAFAALALAAGLLAGCSKETGEWENNGRTATIALRVPMAEAAATRATEEEYQAAETKINTLRVLVISQDNKPIVNQKFDNPGSTVTIDNIPVGTVTICAIANEAALGKNYDDFDAGSTAKWKSPSPPEHPRPSKSSSNAPWPSSTSLCITR